MRDTSAPPEKVLNTKIKKGISSYLYAVSELYIKSYKWENRL